MNAHQRRKARRAKSREPDEPVYLMPHRWMSRDELSLLYPRPDGR